MKLAWWSAGITSAVACKMALELYEDVELYYIHIDSAHSDNLRFKRECEQWYGKKINVLKSGKFDDQFDVIEVLKMVNSPYGAECSRSLKKLVRLKFERKNERNLFNQNGIENQIWGFEYSKKEINRAIRFARNNPKTYPLFPLIEKGLSKENCAAILQNAGIEIPVMYQLGYNNNNCIGCVKGGKGYWNKIRIDFPKIFEKMSKMERLVGYSCINGTFLDELPPDAGRMSKEIIPSCGVICEVKFQHIPDKNLKSILNKDMTIYEAIES